ncbi:MAG TPA: hypothetical protein VFZ70_00185 [Euzebyales bacterium]
MRHTGRSWSRLRITAPRGAVTGPVWSSGFGFGKLDVASLLDY